jgi:hypothetical protein
LRRTWLKKAQVDELISAYIEAAMAYGRATETFDYKTTNRNADNLTQIFNELRGREAHTSLLPLLAHEDPGVRSSAAADALEFAPEQAERTLEQLAAIPHSVLAFSAKTALEQRRKGALRFP